MPRKIRGKYRRPSRRKSRRRRRGNTRALSLTRAPMPKTFKTTLRYSDIYSINPGAGGTAASQVFSANGMYDPDITGAGHQPRGFDQLMAIYDHYTVIASKIAVQAVNSDSSYAQVVGVALRDSQTAETDVNDYIEQGTVKSAVVGHAGGVSKAAMTLGFSNKWLGRSKPLADPELKGSSGANPTEQAFYHVFAAPLAAADSGAVQVSVTIDYICVLTEPKDLVSS